MSETPRYAMVIYVDQWRWDVLGHLGHALIQTPNLDALARDAVSFRNAFAVTTPCAPSRASLMTGLYPMTHRSVQNGTPLAHHRETLPRILGRNDVEPLLFGNTNITPDPRATSPRDYRYRYSRMGPLLDGFHTVVPFNSNGYPYRAYLKSLGYDVDPARHDDLYLPAGDPVPGEGLTARPSKIRAEHADSRFFVEETAKHLAVRGAHSWFAFTTFMRPHPPFIASEPYHAMYDPADVSLPARAATPDAEAQSHPLIKYFLDHDQVKPSIPHGEGLSRDLSEADWRQLIATYYGMITHLDADIGRLIDALKAQELYDKTLLILSGDHGEHMGEHYLLGKNGFHNGAYRVPLIVRDPRAEADTTRGQIFDDFSENVDVLPTLLDWYGIDCPQEVDGISLLPRVTGAEAKLPRTQIHTEFDFRDVVNEQPRHALGLGLEQCGVAAIQDADWKYVHCTALPPALYNMREDPHELNNLAEDPGYLKVAHDYLGRLLSHRMRHMDRTLSYMSCSPGHLIERREPR